MFSLPGTLGLIVSLYLRPLDVFESLRGLPLLQIFLGLAVVGVLLDLRLGVLTLSRTPLTKVVVAWTVWTVGATAFQGPQVLTKELVRLGTIVALFFVIAHCSQTLKGLSRVMGVMLVCVGVLTAVGVHQSSRRFTCVALDGRDPYDGPSHPDKRPCQRNDDCLIDPPLPGADYVCEKVGVFDIFSINGRVRYTGTLKDPNELALTISLGLPLLYVFFERRRTLLRGVVAGSFALAILYCIIETKSRGGALVFGVIVLVMMVRSLGLKGILLTAPLVLPLALVLAATRGSEDASSSSDERQEIALVGLTLLRAFPLNGVGMGQFTQHFYLTAHNAYLLAASELGFFGGVLWTSLVYLSLKIGLLAFVRYRHVPEAATASQLGFVVLASFAGLATGVFFLSFTYHYVFWAYLGIAGALYGAIRGHDPSFSISFGWRDLLGVAAAETVMLTLLYLKVRNAG